MKKAYHIKLSSLYDGLFFCLWSTNGAKLFTFDLMGRYQVRQILLASDFL